MSDTDHSEKGPGQRRKPPARFEVRESDTRRTAPQPMRNLRDPFEDLSVGPRSASRPAVAVRERAQPKRPAIVARPVADEEPAPRPSPLTEALANVRRAESFVEPPARGPRPAYAQGPSYGGGTLMDMLPSGPWLAVIVSAVCVGIIYLLWMQPADVRFSSFPQAREAPHAVEYDPADYPQLATPPGQTSLIGPPSISAEEIDQILAEYGSPAVGTGKAWVTFSQRYKIDAAYAVAFFIHESSAGTNPGWAGIKPDGSTTHNIGNIICAGYPTCFNRFRDYPTWDDGIEDWYKLIAVEYISGRGAHTIEQIIPIYAPSFENDVPAYVGAVNSLVGEWRARGVR